MSCFGRGRIPTVESMDSKHWAATMFLKQKKYDQIRYRFVMCFFRCVENLQQIIPLVAAFFCWVSVGFHLKEP